MSRTIMFEHRLREIERPFGWIPLRLVRDGYWAALSAEAKILYCLLCIVSDRRGISFYGDARLQRDTGLSSDALAAAVRELAADPELRASMGRAGRDFVATHYDRQVLAQRYLELLEEVAEAGPSGGPAGLGLLRRPWR